MKLFIRFLKDESGATALEYALITGAIAIVTFASVKSIGTSISGVMTAATTALK